MARILSQVVGHENLVRGLLRAIESDHLAQTFLFVGPSGIGKKLTALGLAQSLLCEKSRRACGECASCLRVAKGQHESLRILAPEKNQIRIEQARGVIEFLSLKSLTPNRVVIIDGAESLNPQAANSLLKALEEPFPGTHFFLMAPSAAHVLPTLRSRSQIVAFQVLTPEQMRSISPAPEWALRASQGSFDRLRQFMDKGEIEARDQARIFLKTWLQQPQGYLTPDIREFFRDRSHAQSLARHLSLLLRDSVYWHLGGQTQLLNPDATALFEELKALPRQRLLDFAQKALDLENALMQNRDSNLVFEQFWIEN